MTFSQCPKCAAPITQAHLIKQGMGGFTYVSRCTCGLMFDTGALSEDAAAEKWNERPDDAVVFRDLMERVDDICEKFEQAYAEDNNCTVQWCESQRLTNGSYLDRYMSRAWHWWQRAKEAA